MAVAPNDSGTRFISSNGTATASLTTLNVAPGSGNCLIAFVYFFSFTTNITLIEWDFAGSAQPMTYVDDAINATAGHLYVYKLDSPHTGALELKVNFSTTDSAIVGAINFSDVDTLIDIVHGGVSSASTPHSQALNSDANGASFGVIVSSVNGVAARSTGTAAFEANNGVASMNLWTSYILDAGPTNTHTWTKTGAVDTYIGGFHITASAGGGGQLMGQILT